MAESGSLQLVMFFAPVRMGAFLSKYTVVRCGDTDLKSCYQHPSGVGDQLRDTQNEYYFSESVKSSFRLSRD